MWNYRPTAVVTVLYIAVNIYNYSRLVVAVANNSTGFIFFMVGYRDLGICYRQLKYDVITTWRRVRGS